MSESIPKGVIAPAGTIILPILNVEEFFTTRKGLYVLDGFRDNILGSINSDQAWDIEPREVSYYDLSMVIDDHEIQERLPDGHVFENPLTFCIYLMILLICQWNGQEGSLLTGGQNTLFYVRGRNGQVFVVRVYQSWTVDAYALDGPCWHAGRRVFSATADTQAL